MKITYDLEVLPEKSARGNAGKKSEETLAIIAFLAGKQKNMCFEYDDEKQCAARYKSIRSYMRTAKIQSIIDCYRNGKSVYIVKTKNPGNKGKTAPGGRNTESGKSK